MKSVSTTRAVTVGHLVVTLPVLAIGVGAFRYGVSLGSTPGLWLRGVGGLAMAWMWWAVAIPRWRAWALRRGVEPEALYQAARRHHLVMPRGSVWERMEIGYSARGTRREPRERS